MTHHIRQLIVATLIALLALEPIGMIVRADHGADTDPLGEKTRDLGEGIPPNEESAWAAVGRASQNIHELTAYADARKKLKLNPIDARELDRWLAVSQALKDLKTSDPDAFAALEANNFTQLPESIVDQFQLSQKPLAVFSKEVLQGIYYLVTNPEANPAGAGGSFLEVSRLLADYNSEKKAISKEGEEKDPDILERTVSSHYREHVEAADLAAFDQILCTELTIEQDSLNASKFKITDRKKLPAIPIEFIWQADNQTAKGGVKAENAGIGGRGSSDGRLNPNTLGGLLGSSVADLFRRIVRDTLLGELNQFLDEAGWSVPTGDLLLSTDWSVGTTELSDLYDRLGQAIFRDVFGASLGKSPLRFGTSLADTLDRTGAALLSEAFPAMAEGAIGGENLIEWAENLARADLGERLVDSGFRMVGTTGHEIMRNLGLQYFTAKVLNLAPTTALGDLPTGTPEAFRASLGRVAASQKLGLPLTALTNTDLRSALGATFDSLFLTDADVTDARLNLVAGTTARLGTGTLTPDQYFELVGQAVLDTSLGAYAADPTIRMQATNLAIVFGPEDVYLPEPGMHPTTDSELVELATFYQPRLSSADWEFFRSHYKNATATDLDEDAEIRTFLSTHLTEPADLLTPIVAGQATDAAWRDIGLRVLSKIDPKPIAQLGILTYLETGTMPTVATSHPSQRAPIADVDLVAGERLGLLPGDIERLRTDRFTSEVLPRLATDLFLDAIGAQSADPGFAGGLTRTPTYTDEFLIQTIDTLATALQDLSGLSEAGRSGRDGLVAHLRSLTATDWTPTGTADRASRIQAVLTDIGTRYRDLMPHLSVDQRRATSRILASLVSGRTLSELTSLETPVVTVHRALGLTSATVERLFTGEVSPNTLRHELGAAYLANLWDVADPAAAANDLLAAAATGTTQAIADLVETYQATFDELASLYEDTLGLGSDRPLTGHEIARVFMGNRVPLVRRFGNLLHESITSLPGTIFGAGGTEFLRSVGLQQLLSVGDWGGNFEALAGELKNLPQLIFEQSTGLSWATNPVDFLKDNGASFLTLLGAPRSLAAQLQAAYSTDNPGAALELLAKREVWNQIPIEATLADALGAGIGGPIAGALRGMFVDGTDPSTALGTIADHPEQFFPGVAEQLGLPFDPTNLYQAIKDGNDAALQNELIGLGGQFLDRRIAGLANIIQANDHSPETWLSFASSVVPQFFGSPEVAALTNLGVGLRQYFSGENQDLTTLLGTVGQFGTALGIPYVADALLIAVDPRGFGTAYAASIITAQLNSTFGGGYIDYQSVRTALFGPDPKHFAGEAAAIRSYYETASGGIIPSDAFIAEKVREKMAAKQGEAHMTIAYSILDGVSGFPAGFTKAMISGTDEQRIDALLAGASKFGNLPPELNVAIDLIKGGGDISKISSATYGLLDSHLSNLIGVPLPAGFTQGVSEVIQGTLTMEQFSDKVGNFAIGQVSGVLDQQLGLPVGATYTLYQGISQMTDLMGQINVLEQSIISQSITATPQQAAAQLDRLDKLNTQLGQLQAGLVGMGISLVAGQQLGQLEQSLGLPPGTVSFVMNAGLTSLFTGGSFMAALGAAAPWFAASLLIGQFAGKILPLGKLGLGGGKKQKVTWCTSAGFYPFVKPEKDAEGNLEEGIFDPNPDLDTYDPKKRLKPEEVEERLDLWPGYPGEFMGEKSNPQGYAAAKRAAARWKVREVTGHLLLLPRLTGNDRLQPNQLILYNISKATRGKDGDYLKYYDGRETADERFVFAKDDGKKLGIIDWPFPWDDDYPNPGYGNGTPHSGDALHPDSLQQNNYGSYNIGVWIENAEEYRHHIHYGG